MPNFVEGLSGQECAALVQGKCTLPGHLQQQYAALVEVDGGCGALEGAICPAAVSRERAWQIIRGSTKSLPEED